ncbi:hypothetical protein MMC21_004604 [Puttea exsequens]|nr:hypothetical protein [Puttea exsequens]
MPVERPSLLNVHSNENSSPKTFNRLSRSPHPYHRDYDQILQHNAASFRNTHSDSQMPLIASTDEEWKRTGTAYFDADYRKRRKISSSPSGSGTEADDEKGSLLQLPRPPLRPRKGLKGANRSGATSPLLTPSYIDKEPARLTAKSLEKKLAGLGSEGHTDGETQRIREKFVRKRRAELVRRATETVLLCTIGFIACSLEFGVIGHFSESASIKPSSHAWPDFANGPIFALLSHATVLVDLYVLYPIRIVFKNNRQSVSSGRSPFYIHVPAAFDPAPLLYPTLIPIFVALSLDPADGSVLVPNCILSIAAVPSKVIPFNYDVPWHSSLHWLFSMVPSLIPSLIKTLVSNGHQGPAQLIPLTSRDETWSILYPLHQALMPAVAYLTTTSLLPAELQLLSVAMINLLVLSKSPQAIILQSLLWMGGLSIFILCGKILSWEVALARIPSWRFRKTSTRGHHGNVVLSAIDRFSNGLLSRSGPTSAESEDSADSEEEAAEGESSRRQHEQGQSSVDVRRTLSTWDKGKRPPAPAMIPGSPSPYLETNGSSDVPAAKLKRQRRNTLPSYLLPAPKPSSLLKWKWATPLQPNKPLSFRDLTKAQAGLVKWIFASYVYTIIFAIIIFVVRPYVSRYALSGQEPVGWALGYLFDELPAFRHYVHDWNLEYWIYLPSGLPATFRSRSYSKDLLTKDGLGAANVRLLICLYCASIIAGGLAVVFRLSAVAEVDTRRKVFHGMMVAMFLPTIFIDPAFISLALALILAIFLLLDLFRASQLPPLSKPLTYFLAPYVDGRDHRGPVIVSHIFLLIGCAIPLWLSLAAIPRTGQSPWEGWEVERREVSMVSGVICVGMGDAAASLIGRRFGRRRWCWSGGKSLEGSFAFAIAVVIGLSFARWWLLFGGWVGDFGDAWAVTLAKGAIAAMGTSLTEAVLTGGNDNVIVPVVLWLLVRGLRI